MKCSGVKALYVTALQEGELCPASVEIRIRIAVAVGSVRLAVLVLYRSGAAVLVL